MTRERAATLWQGPQQQALGPDDEESFDSTDRWIGPPHDRWVDRTRTKAAGGSSERCAPRQRQLCGLPQEELTGHFLVLAPDVPGRLLQRSVALCSI